MPTAIFSKRYAQAAFEVAQEKGNLDEWQSDLRKVSELVSDIEVFNLIESPKLSFELKANLIKEKLGKINPLVLNLCYLLISKGKLKNTEQIAKEYERLVDEHRGIKHADVITSIPIDDNDKEKLVAQLEAIVGTKVIVDLLVDPELVGGIVARIDSRLIDGSIRNKLELLKKHLTETKK